MLHRTLAVVLAKHLHRLADRLDRSDPSGPPRQRATETSSGAGNGPGRRQSPSLYDVLSRPAVVPSGYAQGRADLQLTHTPRADPPWDPCHDEDS